MKKGLKQLLPLLVLLVLFNSCSSDTPNTPNLEKETRETTTTTSPSVPTENSKESDPQTEQSVKPNADLSGQPTTNSEELTVHFIDVGQGDSILVKTHKAAMLIDGGTPGEGKKVVTYLRNQGVERVDYLVASHPHADHIGGLEEVVRSFEIGHVVMPQISHTTNTYEYFLKALKQKELKITPAIAGTQWDLSPGVTCQVLSPISDDYYELNDYSAVIKVTKGNTAFLFTGDAGNPAEQQILGRRVDLKADVLKVGHHGSRHSTSYAFVAAVSPEFAVISLAADNDYGYPHEETLRRLKGIQIYRTDLSGTVVFTSDGTKVSLKSQ